MCFFFCVYEGMKGIRVGTRVRCALCLFAFAFSPLLFLLLPPFSHVGHTRAVCRIVKCVRVRRTHLSYLLLLLYFYYNIVYIYIYIYICIYVICISIYIYAHTYIHVYTYIRCIHTYICMYNTLAGVLACDTGNVLPGYIYMYIYI